VPLSNCVSRDNKQRHDTSFTSRCIVQFRTDISKYKSFEMMAIEVSFERMHYMNFLVLVKHEEKLTKYELTAVILLLL
jgi:hypothetical protein